MMINLQGWLYLKANFLIYLTLSGPGFFHQPQLRGGQITLTFWSLDASKNLMTSAFLCLKTFSILS